MPVAKKSTPAEAAKVDNDAPEKTNEGLTPLDEFVSGERSDDGSKVKDRTLFDRAFTALSAALVAYVPHAVGVAAATKAGAEALVSLREAIHRGDNDAPDWAGNTTTYAMVVGSYLANAYREATGAEMTVKSDEFQAFRSRVASYMSDHQMVKVAQLRYAAKHDAKAPFSVADVDALVKKGSDAKPTQAMRSALTRSDATQVTADKKGRLNGHKADQTLTVFGRKPRKSTVRVHDTNASSEMTPSVAWAEIAKEVTAGKVKVSETADNAYRVVSSLILALVGPEGEKVPEAADGRADAIAVLGKIGLACDKACAYFSDDGNVNEKSEVLSLLWNEKSK
jgi:hypothetical protein